MLLAKELSDFNSDMYLDLIIKFNYDIEFSETNKFSEKEDLRTLSVNHLMNRLEKRLSVSIDKVEKMLNRNLDTSDLIRLCHIGIEIANAECESNRTRWSAESDESSPNKRKSKEFTVKTPIQSSIPTDLERRISEMEHSSHTGPPAEIDDNKKRWLVVGICLHSILSPTLRKYVEPVVTNFHNSLNFSHQIDKQNYTGHLKSYGTVNVKYLNYKAINNNKTTSGNRILHYDYKVQNAVDLSKLFIETNMAQYTGFDESCDASALLGIIINVDKFPGNVQSAAECVRSKIRNSWAHCNFTEWNSGMYNKSLQNIEDFINLLPLTTQEKCQSIGELNKWKTNGTSYLKDTTLGLELVNDIRHQIQLLVEHEKFICKAADTDFSTVHNELTEIGKTLRQYDKRISSLENKVAIQETTLLKYKSLCDAEPVISSWKQKMKLFVETNVVIDILEILKDSPCALLIGVSGIGKTLTAQNVALRLWHEKEYNIVPCCSLNDIHTRYRDNVNQVFFVDDICGRYTTNSLKIENWMNIEEFVKGILLKGKTKILATCRTEVLREEIFQNTFEMFSKTTYNLSETYSFKDKLVIAEKYLKQDEETLSATLRKVEFTPLMCFLYAQHEHFDINDFLNGPYETFCKEWNKLKSFDKEKYCVLFLCVLYNGRIDESFVDLSIELDKNEKRKLKDIMECCNLGRDTSRVAIKDKLNACIDTYVIKVDKEYKVIHDKMFDFLCCYFGKILIAPIIKYAHDMVIFERVQLESLQEAHGYFTIMVSENDEHLYNDRIKADLANGKIHCCLNNAQMKYKKYRIMFRDIIKDLEINLIRNLINIKDENGINSFIISCLRGYDELVDLFISVGADVDSQIGFFTPLTAACHDGHLQTVEILLKKGSDINNTNTQGETPLYTACFEGHYNLVSLLIEKEADINKQNKYSRSPLHASCMLGHASIVSLLIDKGANVYQCKDLLIAATLGGSDKIVERLISKDCCLDSVDIERKTALYIACEEGYTKIVKLLLGNNADIYKVDSDGKTPLHAACCVGNIDVVSTLISKYSDLDMFDVYLETPLHKACRKGSIGVIQKLLDFRADVNKTNRNFQTPAYIARTEGGILDERILKRLEEEEIDPTEKQLATKGNINEFTSSLIELGWTPLYKACFSGDIETVQSLIRERANVNMKTYSGEMPLVAACQLGHGFILQVLLDKGADVDEALSCAVQK
ncbi:60kDa lysophospholipase, partial [Mytilus galloprovincialis]